MSGKQSNDQVDKEEVIIVIPPSGDGHPNVGPMQGPEPQQEPPKPS